MWKVEYTDQFGGWYDALTEQEQDAILAVVGLLEQMGPALTRPHADTIKGSKYPNMRELRIQYAGRPIRIFYAFDPRRVAILLIGGDKSGDKNFYDVFIAIADALYAEHLIEIAAEVKKPDG